MKSPVAQNVQMVENWTISWRAPPERLRQIRSKVENVLPGKINGRKVESLIKFDHLTCAFGQRIGVENKNCK